MVGSFLECLGTDPWHCPFSCLLAFLSFNPLVLVVLEHQLRKWLAEAFFLPEASKGTKKKSILSAMGSHSGDTNRKACASSHSGSLHIALGLDQWPCAPQFPQNCRQNQNIGRGIRKVPGASGRSQMDSNSSTVQWTFGCIQ